MNLGSKQFNIKIFQHFFKTGSGAHVRPSKDMKGQMTATAKREQTTEGATLRRIISGYPADYEKLTYVY
jgi:hypothetical protein